MGESERRWTDERVELLVGTLLRSGVALSAAVVLFGGAFYLWRYRAAMPDYHVFRGEPSELRNVPGILRGVLTLNGRSLIQLGLLLLIATPIVRVGFSAVAFFLQRDRAYVWITLIVLAILLWSLIGSGSVL
jgi:uncharacterized membrane protein